MPSFVELSAFVGPLEEDAESYGIREARRCISPQVKYGIPRRIRDSSQHVLAATYAGTSVLTEMTSLKQQ